MRISDWSSDVCSSDLVGRRDIDLLVEIFCDVSFAAAKAPRLQGAKQALAPHRIENDRTDAAQCIAFGGVCGDDLAKRRRRAGNKFRSGPFVCTAFAVSTSHGHPCPPPICARRVTMLG